MNIKPIYDYVLIEPLEEDKKTDSGLLLPESSEKRPEQGTIIAAGLGRKNSKNERITMEVKEGQKVLFTKFGPSEIKLEGKEYLIAKESDILAIIE